MTAAAIDTVLFDLDGTLLDTAPDIAAALNLLSAEHGRPEMSFSDIRARVSAGATALVEFGLDIARDAADFDRHRDRLLDLYRSNLSRHTRLFPGMADVLDTLERNDVIWGICTNKPGWLTEPLIAALELDGRAACIVSGDALPERKPRPEPLWHALKLCGDRAAARSLFVGDARRDIEAGRAAGMSTVAALYGYIEPGEHPTAWRADHYIEEPRDLLAIAGIEARAAS
ncbi:MAG TPA: HAD hydrolase-like protein [Gammaproteobacteria bacterium]|nr:HAD hydrolase-like protein [Gammaproteobacteria bacterium]